MAGCSDFAIGCGATHDSVFAQCSRTENYRETGSWHNKCSSIRSKKMHAKARRFFKRSKGLCVTSHFKKFVNTDESERDANQLANEKEQTAITGFR